MEYLRFLLKVKHLQKVDDLIFEFDGGLFFFWTSFLDFHLPHVRPQLTYYIVPRYILDRTLDFHDNQGFSVVAINYQIWSKCAFPTKLYCWLSFNFILEFSPTKNFNGPYHLIFKISFR